MNKAIIVVTIITIVVVVVLIDFTVGSCTNHLTDARAADSAR